MDKILVIDRFEGDIAICEIRESGELIEVEKSKLPKDATDGTVLRYKKRRIYNRYRRAKKD